MLDNEVYIHKMEIVNEEKVDGKYNREGYKIVEYVKHDISLQRRRDIVQEQSMHPQALCQHIHFKRTHICTQIK